MPLRLPGELIGAFLLQDMLRRSAEARSKCAAAVRAHGRVIAAVLVSATILMAAVAVTYLTAAREEDFWWADGASFALNGEFLRDYLTTALGQNPMAFAARWYFRYPALTISLYPPIFPLAEALVFSVFGFSHATAQLTVTLFTFLAVAGMWWMVRTCGGALAATGAALMLLATPEVLRWSREIVMDVPSLAFLTLGAGYFLRYQAGKATRTLLVAVLLVAAAAYTKQTAFFVAPAFLCALIADEGVAWTRRRDIWAALVLGAICLVPLGVFTAYFAAENFRIAFGATTGPQEHSRLSIEAVTMYGRVLPEILGWMPLLGAAGYLALVGWKGWGSRPERRLAVLMLAWFVVDYLAISVTAAFETRYATLLAVPPVVLTVLLALRLAPARLGGVSILAICGLCFALAVARQPVTRVEGYDSLAQFLLEQNDQDDVVMFHGAGSKNLSFSTRTRSPAPKIFILRAEKFLVDYSVSRQWGIVDKNVSTAAIEGIVDRYGIKYIALQPRFWTDQPSVAALQDYVYASGRFELAAQFPITSADPSRATVIRVYRNMEPTARTEQGIELHLPPLGGGISGRL